MLDANEIEFKDLFIPERLERELDDRLRSNWTMREVESGREVPLRDLIEQITGKSGPWVGELLIELKYAYIRKGWDVSIRLEKYGLFKPRGKYGM